MLSLRRLILLIIISLTFFQCSDLHHHRAKRYLLFPFQGTFKTVLSFALPWKLGPKQEMGIGWNFQFLYPLPYNTTAISNYPPTIKRNTRNIIIKEKSLFENNIENDRAIFYEGIEKFLENYNINGKDCILRTICENTEYTHFEDDGGLLEQILHIFLSPKSRNGFDNNNDDYVDAQKAGEFGADCNTLYPNCNLQQSFFNMFSTLYV